MVKIVRMIVANRNAAGVYRPVPNPVANGTLNSIAEMGAAPVTPTKITPHRPMAFGFSRSTAESPAYTDSTVPSCRAATPGSGLVVDIAPLFLDAIPRRQVVLRLSRFNHLAPTEARNPAASLHVHGGTHDRGGIGGRAGAHHDAGAIAAEEVVR